jgi:ATP-binding cassette subfamily B protein
MAEKSFQNDNHFKIIRSDIWRLIKQERRDIWLVVAYSAVISLLSLVVPLASQAIINSVALGVFTNSFFVLCAAIALGLLAIGVLSVLKHYVADVLQRRLFVHTAFEIGYRLPLIQRSAIQGESLPELVNRFFDVMTIQKTLGKFLLDGVNAILIIITGLILLAFYHPFFIIYDIVFLVFLIVLIAILGRGGLKASIKESKKKYALVHWLEEIARCQISFKLNGKPEFIFKNIDDISQGYVKSRAEHFKVIARQVMGLWVFRAFSTVGVVGLGGALVIERQLALGQLVAAELVMLSILSLLAKLSTQFEDYYDLLTAIDKLSYITEKELEPITGEALPPVNSAASVHFEKVAFGYPGEPLLLKDISATVQPGSRISIIGKQGSGRTTLAALLAGMYRPEGGVIELDGVDTRRLKNDALRSRVGLVLHFDEIFEGTIEENITLGREFSYQDIRRALEDVRLWDAVVRMPDGLATRLSGSGKDLSGSFIRQLMFARSIIGRPGVLVLDEAFSGMGENTKQTLVDCLYGIKDWTIIDISNDHELIRRAETVLLLEDGRITASGSPAELAGNNEVFKRLFPTLSKSVLS